MFCCLVPVLPRHSIPHHRALEASTAPPHTHAQALPRPFTKLRELDMEALAAQVAADVQG